MKQLFIVDSQKRTMEIKENDKTIKTIEDVWIGKNGTELPEKIVEFDQKTPLGLYNLGIAFGTEELNINYPYIKINENSYWVDDTNSKYYNYFVQIGSFIETYNYPYIINRQAKEFVSAEHLIEFPKQYKYAIFIEYNCEGQIKDNRGNNKGSAIFLHCHGDKGYTGGCIAIKKEDMQWILGYIDRNKNPQILIK